jgi:hypothetical protein
MEAIEGALLAQVPPPKEFVSVVLVPGHTWLVPAIEPGFGFTVNVETVPQPPAK